MGRKKALISQEYQEIISKDIKQIPDNEVIIKLKAIQASINHKVAEVAEFYDIGQSTLMRWISTYKKFGIEGLKAKGRGHNPSKLSQTQKLGIKEWIISGKDSKGKQVHWTLKRLIKEIYLVYQIEITKTPLWLILISMRLSLKKPRPEHHKSDKDSQEAFKKNSRNDGKERR